MAPGRKSHNLLGDQAKTPILYASIGHALSVLEILIEEKRNCSGRLRTLFPTSRNGPSSQIGAMEVRKIEYAKMVEIMAGSANSGHELTKAIMGSESLTVGRTFEPSQFWLIRTVRDSRRQAIGRHAPRKPDTGYCLENLVAAGNAQVYRCSTR